MFTAPIHGARGLAACVHQCSGAYLKEVVTVAINLGKESANRNVFFFQDVYQIKIF
jgi:hypothetical protein